MFVLSNSIKVTPKKSVMELFKSTISCFEYGTKFQEHKPS